MGGLCGAPHSQTQQLLEMCACVCVCVFGAGTFSKELFRDSFSGVGVCTLQDPHVVDLLVFKGRQDLEEMMMKWKTPMHLRQFLDQETHVQKTRPVSASLSPSRQESAPAQPPSDFLKRFLSGGKQ